MISKTEAVWYDRNRRKGSLVSRETQLEVYYLVYKDCEDNHKATDDQPGELLQLILFQNILFFR